MNLAETIYQKILDLPAEKAIEVIDSINGKVIACAAMRKLIHLAFAILKSGKPFDTDYASKKLLTCS